MELLAANAVHPGPGRHRRDPRHPRLPLRRQHRPHGRRPDRRRHAPERGILAAPRHEPRQEVPRMKRFILPSLGILAALWATYLGRADAASSRGHRSARSARRSPTSRTPWPPSGLVEASTENISVGTPLAGVVSRVFVTAGPAVKAGDPLFELDARHLRAELAVRQQALGRRPGPGRGRASPARRPQRAARVRRAGEGPARDQRRGADPPALGGRDRGGRARGGRAPRSRRPRPRSRAVQIELERSSSARRSTPRSCRSRCGSASSRPRPRPRRP